MGECIICNSLPGMGLLAKDDGEGLHKPSSHEQAIVRHVVIFAVSYLKHEPSTLSFELLAFVFPFSYIIKDFEVF